MPYIYKITNAINGKVYIGQTIKSLRHRFLQHVHNALRDRNYVDCHLRKAMRKHGVDNFSIEPLEECDASMLNEREIYWISKYDSRRKGYNETDGGDTHTHQIGVPLSEAHKAALREAHKRRDPSTYKGGAKTPEGKAAAVEKFRKTYWSKPEEVRREQARKSAEHREPSRYWQGKSIPQDMRNKISQTLKEKHLCPPQAIMVYCWETGETYRSLTEAEQKTGVDRHIIKRYIDGKRKDNNYHFKIVEEKEI